MLEPQPPTTLDLRGWIQKARTNPTLYRQRQLTEILLHAIARTPGFEEGLFLKGGILMALAYHSPRTTTDIDFSAIGDPEEMEQMIKSSLDVSLSEAATRAGHFDVECRVQRVTRRPRPSTFAKSPFPALEITIGSALKRDAAELERLKGGRASKVLRIDLSFREPIDSFQRLVIGEGQTIQAYSLYDLIAEKFRSLLQQLVRNRDRRQDVYDLARLLQTFDFDQAEKILIFETLQHKSREREIEPTKDMISDPRLIAKVRQNWSTLKDELEDDLPDFEATFKIVQNFYETLPWMDSSKPKDTRSMKWRILNS